MTPAGRYIQAAFCAAAVAVLFLLLWYGRGTFFLAFAGTLLAIALRSAADLISRLTRLGAGASLALTVVLCFAVLTGVVLLAGPHIGDQIDQLGHDLPGAW